MRGAKTCLRVFAAASCIGLVTVALANEVTHPGADAAEPGAIVTLRAPGRDYDVELPRETVCALVTDDALAPVADAVVDWALAGTGTLELVTSLTDEFGETCNRYDFPDPVEDAPFSITAFSSVGGVLADDTAYFSAPGHVTYHETQDNFCFDDVISYNCFSRDVSYDAWLAVAQLGADEWAVAAVGPYSALYTGSLTYPEGTCSGTEERTGGIAGPQYAFAYGDPGTVGAWLVVTFDYNAAGECNNTSETGTAKTQMGLSGTIVPDADGNAIAIDFTEERYDPVEEVTFTTAGRVELAAPPIIFIHGFLGSRIMCGADELWPNIPPSPKLLEMRLADDGVTNLPGAVTGCTPEVGPLLDSVLGSDVYGTTEEFLTSLAGGSAYYFNWDWRTTPEQSLALLDAFVDNIRSTRGGQKVVIMAHSYGGLLTRWYIDEPARAEKVARVLTLGTPAWGAPKALFPLYAGIEAPDFSTLDPLMDNDDLKAFAENLFGNYFLLPSANFGPWLQVYPDPDPLTQEEVLDNVEGIGGNRALLASAQASHAAILDAAGPSSVPFEVIAGSGLPTIAGISVRYDGRLQIRYANGDGTVPVISAARGPADTTNANAARTHYTCGIGHVPLPGHPTIVDAVSDYLMIGAPIVGLSATPCAFEGLEFKLFDLPPLAAAGAMTLSSPGGRLAVASAAPAGAITAEEADTAHLADYLDLPNEKILITGHTFPDIVLPPGGMLEVSDILADGTAGPARTYGPLSGEVVISSQPDGPVVYVDGEPVEPQDPDATPSPTPSVTPSPTPMPTDTPPAAATSTPTDTATPTNTATHTPTPTNTATHTPPPTNAATHTPTPTNTATHTATPTDTATQTPVNTATHTPTPTDTATVAPTNTATHTPTPTDTATLTPVNTATNTPTPTDTATHTPTPTDTATHTPTPTDTATVAPTDTATHTPPPTDTATHTPPPTDTATVAPADTATHTPTPVNTATHTPTASQTATHTPTLVSSSTLTATPTQTSGDACADVTGDGRVTIRDVITIAKAIAARRQDSRSDVNGDGRVDARDLLLALSQLGRRCSFAMG